MEAKHPKDSLTILTDTVLPSETNPLNNLFGGELLARMDRAASITARRHSRRIVVTASVNHVAFNRAVPLGSVVTIEAKVSRAFNSSMEIYLDVWIDDAPHGVDTSCKLGIETYLIYNERTKRYIPEDLLKRLPVKCVEKISDIKLKGE